MPGAHIRITLADQRLRLTEDGGGERIYAISSAAKGAGERNGSNCSPRGQHRIRALIGAGSPANTVFVARRPTGETYSPALGRQFPDRDWILTRILWLSGCERGRNRLGDVDTMRRYIYVHGFPDELPVGVPGSHGCIRMRNQDVIDLFDRVCVGTPVLILE